MQYWASLIIHLTIVALAAVIRDIALIFEFSGTMGSSSISFFFPAIAYLLALRNYGTPEIRAKWHTKCN